MPPDLSTADLTPLDSPGINHSDSNGFIQLEAGDKKRKQGTSMIARQIEHENMKARQINAHQKVSDKNLEVMNEQKMNQVLAKMNAENHQAEQWQTNMKKQKMRENIAESL